MKTIKIKQGNDTFVIGKQEFIKRQRCNMIWGKVYQLN